MDSPQSDLHHEADAANDAQLLRDLRAELQRVEAGTAGDIHATVLHGVAILSGSVPRENMKAAARSAARGVPGIEDVCDDIRIRPDDDETDENILARVRTMLAIDATLDANRLSASVTDGRAALSGHVEWPAQASAAVAAVRRVRGVRDVTSTIHVDGLPSPAAMRARLVLSFRDAAEAAAAGIDVAISARSVRLSGTLKSNADRDLAEATIRALPGVDEVENRIVVE
ncbi:MAG TPA: BON domain-containing protein [Sphingomonas sp.]